MENGSSGWGGGGGKDESMKRNDMNLQSSEEIDASKKATHPLDCGKMTPDVV